MLVPCAGVRVGSGAWGGRWLGWWAYFEEGVVPIVDVLLTLSGYFLGLVYLLSLEGTVASASVDGHQVLLAATGTGEA